MEKNLFNANSAVSVSVGMAILNNIKEHTAERNLITVTSVANGLVLQAV